MLGDDALPLILGRVRELNQGDLIATSHFPTLGVPEATFHPDTELAEVCAGQSVWAAPSREILSGWSVITSQTCDLVESAEREPWIQVSPLIAVTEDVWRRAGHGRDGRAFALPSMEGVAHPVVQPQVVFTIEKSAVLHPGVRTVSTPLDSAQRIHLSMWLARRCGRHAFPDPTEDLILRPLRRELDRRFGQGSQVGAFTRCLLGVWATAHEAAEIHVCFMINPTLLAADAAQIGITEEQLQAHCDVLLRPSANRIAPEAAAITVAGFPRTLDRIDGHRLLFEMRQVDMELLPAQFGLAQAAEASSIDAGEN